MWSLRKRCQFRRSMDRVRIFAVMVSLCALTGCGFQPLYGVTSTGATVSSELSQIQIPEPKTRLEQLIRNSLLESMSPAGGPVSSRYLLEFAATEDVFDAAIERTTDVSRRVYRLKVKYTLRDTATQEVLQSGSTFSHVAYDRVFSDFQNLQSLENAKERAAHQVAQDMRLRIAAWFSST